MRGGKKSKAIPCTRLKLEGEVPWEKKEILTQKRGNKHPVNVRTKKRTPGKSKSMGGMVGGKYVFGE